MNTYTVLLLVAIAAMATAYDGGYGDNRHNGYGYQDGFRRVHNGIATPYNNAARQQAVNYEAERVGASSGTARYYGVPGTGRSFGYPGYHRNGNYGYNNYGYKY